MRLYSDYLVWKSDAVVDSDNLIIGLVRHRSKAYDCDGIHCLGHLNRLTPLFVKKFQQLIV